MIAKPAKALFALRKILFGFQNMCERFFAPTKISASATKLQRFCRLALEAVKILPGEKILCSLKPSVIGSSNFPTYGLQSKRPRMTSRDFN